VAFGYKLAPMRSSPREPVTYRMSGLVLVTTGSFFGIGDILVQLASRRLDRGHSEPFQLEQEVPAGHPGQPRRLAGRQLACREQLDRHGQLRFVFKFASRHVQHVRQRIRIFHR